MNLKLKNKSLLKKLIFFSFLSIIILCGFGFFSGVLFNGLDWKILDVEYTKLINDKAGPQVSNRIKYLNISKDTYNYFKRNYLNRSFLSKVNNLLADLEPQAIIYDVIFSFPSNHEEDSLFSESIKNAQSVYLPVGFKLFAANDTTISNLQEDKYFNTFVRDKFKKPKTFGESNAPVAKWVHSQLTTFGENCASSGQINSLIDDDGIYRRTPMLIDVGSTYIPAISLSVFLDYNEVPFDSLLIYWGDKIVIPAIEDSYISDKIEIPIDENGNTYIPFPGYWEKSFDMMEAQNLVKNYDNAFYYDELIEFFEGNFIFIGDVSPGISDLGNTSIEKNVPLISIHSAMLNALMQNTFYSKMSNINSILIFLISSFIIGFFSLFKNNSWFFSAFVLTGAGLIYLSYYLLSNQIFLPIATISGLYLITFLLILITSQILSTNEQAFIKNTFSKYVPPKVVDNVLDNPGLLKLGGDETEISILFSDIANFTSIAEKMDPPELVKFLNEYFTEMTNIILKHGGIVDKYLGDGILAEFGVPLKIENHANSALFAAIEMKDRLNDLNIKWSKNSNIKFASRVGINSGIAVVGNMGSNQVFDYTAIGDNVNLASRLEGANKYYHSSIMISEFTQSIISDSLFRLRPLDFVKVKGRKTAVKVFEVFGKAGDKLAESDEKYIDYYTRAFELFEKSNFHEAKILFLEALRVYPNDPAADSLVKRIDKFINKNNTVKIDLANTMTFK